MGKVTGAQDLYEARRLPIMAIGHMASLVIHELYTSYSIQYLFRLGHPFCNRYAADWGRAYNPRKGRI